MNLVLIFFLSPDIFSASTAWACNRKIFFAQRIGCRWKPTFCCKYTIEGYVVFAFLNTCKKSKCYSWDRVTSHPCLGDSTHSWHYYLLDLCLQQVTQLFHQLGEPWSVIRIASPAVQHDLVAVRAKAKRARGGVTDQLDSRQPSPRQLVTNRVNCQAHLTLQRCSPTPPRHLTKRINLPQKKANNLLPARHQENHIKIII